MYPMSTGSNTDGLQYVFMSGGTVGITLSHNTLMYHCHKAAYCAVKYPFPFYMSFSWSTSISEKDSEEFLFCSVGILVEIR